MNRDLKDLSNRDVEWHGTAEGLSPDLATERAKRLAGADAEAVTPGLIAALSEEDRFVAAHVVLTSVSRVEYSAFPTWNGLRVDIRADGSVVIDPGQRHELARRWQRWHRTTPRPATLGPE